MTADRLTLVEASATATCLIDCITPPEFTLLWKYAEHYLINMFSAKLNRKENLSKQIMLKLIAKY